MSSASDRPETAGAAIAVSDDEEAPAGLSRRPQRRAAAAAVAATAAAVAAAASSPPREDPAFSPPPTAAAAAAARRRGGGRGSASREAPLNPPRQPRPSLIQEDPLNLRNTTPSQAAAQYQGAALRLQGTLNALQQKINRRSGHVSADDLDLMYRQFDAFVNTHPLYSPAARRVRVLAAAGQAAEAAAAQRRAVRAVKKQRRPGEDQPSAADLGPPPHPQWRHVAGSLSALAADAERLMGGMQSMTHGGASQSVPLPPPPAPVWAIHGVAPAPPAPPPAAGAYPYGPGTAGAQALSQHSMHSMHSTISSYAPHMSADPLATVPPPPQGAAPGPEDSAAIAMATAAAMANAGGGLDNRSAYDLLQMLTAFGYGGGGGGGGPLEGGADELAATALMSLGTDEPSPPRRGPGRPPKRPAPGPAPTEGAVPPAPEIDQSVESQLLALLVQGLGPGMG
jgi:hypothetical protein